MKFLQGFAIAMVIMGVSVALELAGTTNVTSTTCIVRTTFIYITKTVTTTRNATFTPALTGLSALTKIEITPTFHTSYSTKTFTSYITVLTETPSANPNVFTSNSANSSEISSAGSTNGLSSATPTFIISPSTDTSTIAVVPSPYLVPSATTSPTTEITPTAAMPKSYASISNVAAQSTVDITTTITVCLSPHISAGYSLLQDQIVTSTSTSTHYITKSVVKISPSANVSLSSSPSLSSLHQTGNEATSDHSQLLSDTSTRPRTIPYHEVRLNTTKVSTTTIATNITTTVDSTFKTQSSTLLSTLMSAGTSEGNVTSLDPKADGTLSG